MKWRAALAAALVLALLAPDAAEADCATDLRKLARTRKQRNKARVELRTLLLAGEASKQAEVESVQKRLSQLDAKVDELIAATKGCKIARRRRKARRPKVARQPKVARPPEVAAPAPAPRPAAPAPTPSVKVVLSPEPLRPAAAAPADPCRESAYRAVIPPLRREGRPARTPGAFSAWSERQRRHDEARRMEEHLRDKLDRCRTPGSDR
jgi:hypothetical protein